MRIKVKNILDKFWRQDIGDKSMELLHYDRCRPFIDLNPAYKDSATNEALKMCTRFTDTQHLYKLKAESIICPFTGHIISGLRTLVGHNIVLDYTPKPSVPKRLSNIFSARRISEAIIFDSEGLGSNYFHFLVDVLSKIYFVEKFDFLNDIPLIVSQKTYSESYFQFLLNHQIFKNRPLIVLEKDGSWTRVKKLYLAKAYSYDKQNWTKIADLGLSAIEKKENKKFEKIYLKRNDKIGRHLVNNKEIEDFLVENGFAAIDTDNYTFEEQINLFRQVKYIIAVHGAGLTNILFSYRNNPRILEICPSNRIPGFYYWIADRLDCYHDLILGSDVDRSKHPEGNFQLDINILKNAYYRLTSI